MSRSIAASPAKPSKRAGKRPKATANHDAPEHGHELMQTVLDNMSEGVALFDKDLRLRFINRQCMEFQSYPASIAYPGASGYDVIRFQIERGDFGPVADIDQMLAERWPWHASPAAIAMTGARPADSTSISVSGRWPTAAFWWSAGTSPS